MLRPMPARVLPEAFESLIIRRRHYAGEYGPCDICETRPAHWQIVSKWAAPDGERPQWLTTHLCPIDGWEFVSALGDNLRAGDP